MKTRQRIHMVLLGDLEEHSVREVCQGAAEYVASRPGLDFDPWATYPGRSSLPSLADLNRADCLLLSEATLRLIGVAESGLKMPHVFYLANDRHRRTPAVALDERAIGQMAAEHLISRGYQSLAFFGCATMPWSKLRGEGFREAAATRGFNVRQHESPPYALPVYRSARWKSREHELSHALRSLPMPCGIFAANDVIACYVIQAARALGFRVPEQLGVLGVDDDPIPNAASGLAISTVHVPFREAGRRAAALLDDRTRGKTPPRPAALPPVRVVVRTSTNAFMVGDSLVRRAQTYMAEHHAERLTVGQIVQALRTTPVTLGKRFRQHLKLTPSQYILQRRLEYAKELLRAGDLSVAQIAEACHFHDCSYFCQVFKRAIGTSPGALRPPGQLRAPL